MEIIEYVEKLDNKFINITKNYNYIYENIHNYLTQRKITYNQIMDFEVSLEDLSINLNSLVFLFKQKQNETIDYNSIYNNNNNNINNNIKESKIDYIIDKTLFQFMPLLFIYFMIFDKESILYVKDFIENKYNINSNTNDNETINREFEYIIEDIDD